MAGLNVINVDTDTFIVSGGDYSQTFKAGRRVKLNCGINGYAFGTIESVLVSGGDTYVNLTATSDPLSASCVEAWYGIQSQGVDGSVPIHTHDGLEGSGGIVNCCNDDIPASQAIRTTTYNYPTGALVPSAAAWGTIQFNATCLQNAPNVIFHNPSGADGGSRITFLEAGLYHVGFGLTADYSADASTETHFEARCLKNGSLPISASDVHDGNYYSLTGNTSEDNWVHCTFYCNFEAGDYVEVQARAINLRAVTGFASTSHNHKISFWASKAQGSQGPIGPSGSGSTINIKSDSILVSGSPFQILNFIGFDATPVSGGQVNISGGGSILQVDRTNITNVITTTSTLTEATTPTSTTGVAFGSNSITLEKSDSTVRVQITIPASTDNDAGCPTAIVHRGTTVLAVAVITPKKDYMDQISFDFYDTPGSVGPHTYSVRVATRGNTSYFNRSKNNAAPYGGTLLRNNCWLSLTEIAA